jgi:hypothetical protein
MEKTKLLFLISDETLLRRIEILKEQIKECEGEIPYNFWCDCCKEKMKKMKTLLKKIYDKETVTYTSLSGGHLDSNTLQEAIEQIKQADPFSKPTPTFRYKCSICGRVWMEGVRLGIYRDLNKNVDRCSTCNGRVDAII